MSKKVQLTTSFIRSCIRIIGCGLGIIYKDWNIAIWGLLIAETIKFLEESNRKG